VASDGVTFLSGLEGLYRQRFDLLKQRRTVSRAVSILDEGSILANPFSGRG
jgi:hypothetical protein